MSVLRKVSVAVLSWNGRGHLQTSLPALEAQVGTGVPYEILVLDNGSTDDTTAWVRRHHPGVRLERSDRNLGFCAGNNLLVSIAGGDAVAFLNDDTRPSPTWLGALVSALADAPDDVAAVSGLLTDWAGARLDCARGVMTFDGHAFRVGRGRPLPSADVPRAGDELFFPTGANMLVRRDAFLAAGGFDEDYFAYYEDVDLGWRLWAGGQRVVCAPDAVAAHRSGATGDRLGHAHRGTLFERNSFLTAYKNYEAGLWERMMPAVLLTLLSRTQSMLVGNPLGDQLAVDPFRNLVETGTAPAPSRAGRLRQALLDDLRELRPAAFSAPRITQKPTVAQFRALDFILRHLDRAAVKRAAVQARRRRSDREILERFPPYLVPTYPGDEALFDSAGFRSWLPGDVRLVECALGDLVARA